MKRAWWVLCVMGITGCWGQLQDVTVSLRIESSRQPTNALDHTCYALSVSGPGLSTNASLPAGVDAACLGLGRVSALVSPSGLSAGLSVSLPPGTDRRIRLLGLDYAGGCPATEIGAAIASLPPRIHVLGDVTQDVLSDALVPLPNIYHGASADILGPCTTMELQGVTTPQGGLRGGHSITLTGQGFLPGATVTVGGNPCVAPRLGNGATLTCVTIPNSLGTKPVTVTNPGGATSTLSAAYTYVTDLTTSSFGTQVAWGSSNTPFPSRPVVFGDDLLVVTKINGAANLAFQDSVATNTFTFFSNILDGSTFYGAIVHQGDFHILHEVTGSNQVDKLLPSDPLTASDAFSIVGAGPLPSSQQQGMDIISEDKLLIAITVSASPTEIHLYKLDAGDVWTRADNNEAINFDNSEAAKTPFFARFQNNTYITWAEYNTGLAYDQIYVARNDGTVDTPNWVSVVGSGPGGLNQSEFGFAPVLVPFRDRLYAFWAEGSVLPQIQGAVRISDDNWLPLPSPSNGANSANHPHAIVAGDRLYLTWEESNSEGFIRLAVYNGDDEGTPAFYQIDGGAPGINLPLDEGTQEGQAPRLISFQNQLYVFFGEDNGGSHTQLSARATLP